MAKFSYTAVDSRGVQAQGMVEASDQNDAIAQIRQLGYYPQRLDETQEAAAGRGATKLKVKQGGKVKTAVLNIFTRQLATLIDAGLPIVRGLKTLSRQEKNVNMKRTIDALAEAVESGNTFSEALSQHPQIFNKLYINMVKAGEIGGVIELVLNRLAEFQEKSQKIRGKVASAMVYPGVVLSLALVILLALLIFIVPKFQQIFAEALPNKPLPAMTQFVIGAKDVVFEYWYLLLGGGFLVVVGFQFFSRTIFGSIFLDRLSLRLPIFGGLLLKSGIARFSRTLGTLISSGVPILQALTITRDTSSNYVMATSISKIHDSVREGESVVGPMEASGVFPPMVTSMVQVGEETGQLPDMLVKVADVYEGEVDNVVAGLASLLEPVMIVILAVIVGFIVISLFLPMIGIITGLSDQSNG